MADEQEREQPVTDEKAEETPGLPVEKPRKKNKPRRSRAKKTRTPRPDDGKRHLRPWRVVVALLSLGILIWSALPLGVGVKNIGVVLGIIAAGILTMIGSFEPSEAVDVVYPPGQVFGFLLLWTVPIGIALGGVVGLIFDRLSRRSARTVRVTHETIIEQD